MPVGAAGCSASPSGAAREAAARTAAGSIIVGAAVAAGWLLTLLCWSAGGLAAGGPAASSNLPAPALQPRRRCGGGRPLEPGCWEPVVKGPGCGC